MRSCALGSRGALNGFIAVELSLSTLHGEHAATTLPQDVAPPRHFGIT